MNAFKIGTKSLETTNRSGYETDELTIGKIVDNKGIPYEFKGDLKKRQDMLKRQKIYGKELKERGRRMNFNPFKDDE